MFGQEVLSIGVKKTLIGTALKTVELMNGGSRIAEKYLSLRLILPVTLMKSNRDSLLTISWLPERIPRLSFASQFLSEEMSA